MQNYLILYNPYYENNVIGKHLEILKAQGQVAFGKVRSKLRTDNKDADSILQEYVCPLQLFLTDYEHFFVAKVSRVCLKLDTPLIAPDYYARLDIEAWFIIEDLRELVRGDFKCVRDVYLANFTTPTYNNHTFTIYGNPYEYPLRIELKKPENYFEQGKKYYIDALQSAEFIETKKFLVDLNLGEDFMKHCLVSTLENLTRAELEVQKYKNEGAKSADCSHIIVFYARSFEQEIWEFIKMLFEILGRVDSQILDIPYQVQGIGYCVKNIFNHKPNLGTYTMLLRKELVGEQIERLFYKNPLKYYLKYTFPKHIKNLQEIRNTSLHEKQAHLQEALTLRALMLGIGLGLGENGAIVSLINAKSTLKNFQC